MGGFFFSRQRDRNWMILLSVLALSAAYRAAWGGGFSGPGTTSSAWTDEGSVVRLTTTSRRVGIGTTTPSNNAKVEIVRSAAETWATGLLVSDGDISCPGSGSESLRYGVGATAPGVRCLALGNSTVADGQGSIALGFAARTNAGNQMMIGSDGLNARIIDVYFTDNLPHANPQPVTIHGPSGTLGAYGNPFIRLASGTASADAALGGDVRLAVAVLGSATAITDVVYVTGAGPGGRVGIGASPAAFVLDVNGATRVQGTLTVTGAIQPSADDIVAAGAASTGWKNLYLASAADTTAGNVATINKASGRFRKGTTGTAFTLTNSRITAASHVFANLATLDATATNVNSVVPAAGSAVFNLNAAPTANVDVDFLVVNVD